MYRQALDPSELVYCGHCDTPMLYIYDYTLRRFCHDCLQEEVLIVREKKA